MFSKVGIYRDTRKAKSYVVRWWGEFDPQKNRARRYSRSFLLKRAAEAFQREKESQFQSGLQRDKIKDISLSDFFKIWREIRHPKMRISTQTGYENTIRRLLTFFGHDTYIRIITPLGADRFIAGMALLKNDKKDISIWSRNRALRDCKTIFKWAAEKNFILSNPFTKIEPTKAISQNWHHLTPEEYKKLLSIASIRNKALYAIAYCCGLRLGELLNLMWDNIYFDNREIIIKNREGTAEYPPFLIKDSESRTIPLPGHVFDILIDLKNYDKETGENCPFILLNEEHYSAVLAKWKTTEKSINWQPGDMQNICSVLYHFKHDIQAAGIKPTGKLSIHTLRKACITNWSNTVNNPKVVMQLAGHSDISTTMKYYVQITKEQKILAVQGIDNLIWKN